jgi:putative DNA primase/helicase
MPVEIINIVKSSSETLNPQKVQLIAPHYKECIEKRELPADWIKINCRSVTTEEASLLLGYPAKSGGIWLSGIGIQGQFKPDKPWLSPTDKSPTNKKQRKAPKYRSPQDEQGDYDAILPIHPNNPTYWSDLEALKAYCYQINGVPCLVLTEGFFKALAGCSNNFATLALLGVEMGLTSSKTDIQGKRYLVKTLEKYARAGFGFIIAFDADCATNSNVVWAQYRLSKQLLKFQVPVYSVTGNWTVAQGKGMDDYIQINGGESFKRDVLGNAIAYADWLKIQKLEGQFNHQASALKKPQPPSPRALGLEIAAQYHSTWKFCNEQKSWRIYNGKVWEDIEEEAFHQEVFNVIESMQIEWKLPVYVDNTIRVLKDKLLVKKWLTFDRKRYIAFNNIVLDTSNHTLLDHSPSFGFTSYLPYDYNLNSAYPDNPILALLQKCPHIYEFMQRAMGGDAKRMYKLLAIINGAIKFRFHDLQMFVHLFGKPGTGKGTFSRILEQVVGAANTQSSSLTALSEGTEIAAIIDKQLVIFPDERRQVGVETLLKLTGGDKVRYREIYKKRGEAHFFGLALILSNNPTFAGDTTGIDRRLCLAQFLNPIPKHLRTTEAEKRMETEIPNLISIALGLQDSQVTSLIKGLGNDEIPEFKQQEWLMKCQTNSIAAHANEWLIYDPNYELAIGDGRRDEHGQEKNTCFGHYRDFCEISGLKPFSLVSYSSTLLDVLTDGLEWEVSKKRTNTGVKIKGIRLRQPGVDDDIPRIDEFFVRDGDELDSASGGEELLELSSEGLLEGGLEEVKGYAEEVLGCVETSVGLKPALLKESVGYEGLNEQKDFEKNQQTDNDSSVVGMEELSSRGENADLCAFTAESEIEEVEQKEQASLTDTSTQSSERTNISTQDSELKSFESCTFVSETEEVEKRKQASLTYTSTQSSEGKGFEPTLNSTQPYTNPTPGLTEVDYSSFPHLTCDRLDAKRNQAQSIKKRLLAAQTKEQLMDIKAELNQQCQWVWRYLLTSAEKGKIKAIASVEQLNLLELPSSSVSAVEELNLVSSPNSSASSVEIYWYVGNRPAYGLVNGKCAEILPETFVIEVGYHSMSELVFVQPVDAQNWGEDGIAVKRYDLRRI